MGRPRHSEPAGWTPPRLEVSVLGPFRVELCGRPVDVAPKEATILTLLAVRAGSPVALHELAEALWMEDPPPSLRKSIQVHVSRLRRRLERHGVPDANAVVATSGSGYCLELNADAVDLHRFERLVDAGRRSLRAADHEAAAGSLQLALALWRGEPLDALVEGKVGQATRARLEELRLAALEARHEALLAMGGHDDLVGIIEEVVAEHPLRERLWCQLLLALHRTGRTAEALRAYQRARALLIEQLGIEPGQELRAVEQAILSGDVDQGLRPGVRRESEDVTPDLHGRPTQVAALASAAHRAEEGLVVVSLGGVAGSGSRALAAAVAARVTATSGVVLHGRCDEQVPGSAFRGVLERWGREPAGRDEVQPDPAVPSDPCGLAWSVRNRFEHSAHGIPRILLLSDLERADRTTLATLRILACDHGDLPLLILTSYDAPDAASRPEVLDLLDDLHCASDHVGLDLPPLSAEEGAQLVARVADVPADRSSLASLAQLSVELDGRPEYLVAAAEQVRRRRGDDVSSWVPSGLSDLEVPNRLRRDVARTLRRLSAPHDAVVDAAAVLGCEFDLADLVAASDRPLEEVVTTVELGASAGLLREDAAGRAAFVCQGMRTAVLERLSPNRRRLIERQVATPVHLALAPA